MQSDNIKVVNSIKCGWNTIASAKFIYLGHFIRNVWGIKIHTSSKISKFGQYFRGTKTHMGKIFGVWFFIGSLNITRAKITLGHIIFIHQSYNEIVVKIVFMTPKTVQKWNFNILGEALSHLFFDIIIRARWKNSKGYF